MTKIWMNNALIDGDAAHIPVRDRGFLLGDGVFETLRVQNSSLRNVQAHLSRLKHGAGVLGIDVPECVDRALHETMKANAIQQGSVRLTLTRGSGGRGLDIPETVTPLLVVTAVAHEPQVSSLNVQLVTDYRRDHGSPLAHVKALGYLPHILARQHARKLHADDALIPNTSGKLSCATVANVLLWYEGHWTTPPLQDGALPGTARAELLAKGLIQERSWPLEALRAVEGMALVNALSLRAVVQCDGRALAWPLEACDTLTALGNQLELSVEV